MRFAQSLPSALFAALIIGACSPGDVSKEPEPTGKVGSAEKIDSSNDPNRFRLDFSRSYASLPRTGTSLRKPFPSNWWPMSRAGIAQSWNSGQPGPAQKYDQLVTPDQIRDVQLTLAKKNWKDEPVNENAQPETFHVGPAGEWEMRNHGRYGDTDPEGWWGHCNGWASYVLNEDEPTRPVSVRYDAQTRRVTECASASEAGCVRFELGDINALGAEIYWHDGARMVGRRCEQEGSEFNFDSAGRVNAIECRDGNAATFHLVATNMIGRLERPFIVDLNADRQVWNYPVYRFEIDAAEEVSLDQALRLVGAPTSTRTWVWNPDAVRFVSVKMRAWIVEDSVPPTTRPTGPELERYTTIESYEYILELNGSGNIDGGEWIGRSKTEHPDFMWYSFSNSSYDASSDDLYDGDNTAIRYSIFKQILTLAQRASPPPPPPPNGAVRVEASPNAAIPDNNTTGVTSNLEVGESFTIDRATVTVDIRHTYRGDLRVVLRHADREQVLANQEGGSADDLNLVVDAATFAGAAARGSWVLVVTDHAGQDTGTLVRWSVELTRASGGGGGGGGGGTGPRAYEARPAAAIPDATPAGVTSAIRVPDAFRTTTVRATVEITHPYRGDLEVTLIKGDRRVVLHSHTGGSQDDLRQTFDVPSMVGIDAAGTWELLVVDSAQADVGRFDRWALELGGAGGGGGGGGGGGTVTRELSVTPNVAVPDNTAGGVVSTIEVTEQIRISNLRVEINIDHTYIGDLTVVLEKDGVTQTLHDKAGGSADDIRRTFDTLAFNNANARGTWRLRVIDSAAADTGTLEGWRLIITGQPL